MDLLLCVIRCITSCPIYYNIILTLWSYYIYKTNSLYSPFISNLWPSCSNYFIFFIWSTSTWRGWKCVLIHIYRHICRNIIFVITRGWWDYIYIKYTTQFDYSCENVSMTYFIFLIWTQSCLIIRFYISISDDISCTEW